MKIVFDFIKNKIKLNNTPKSRLFLKQISLLCAIMLMLICVVWAWFTTFQGEVEATGLSLTMGASDSMLISLDGGNSFHESIDLLSDADQDKIGESNKIKGKLSMQDITSDGEIFYRPKFNETDGQRIPNTNENWDAANKNVAYISQDIIFRTSKPCNIYMGKGTKIVTSCELTGTKLVSDIPSEIGNKSSAGNFSNDCIVGALRISAIDTSDSNEPCCFVCIPRSDVEFDYETKTMNTGDDLSGSNEIHTFYSSTYQTTHSTEEDWNAITAFDGTQLITSTAKKVVRDGVEGYEATATINLWLEGCDPEVTRLLSGGKYKVAFDFIGTEN